MSTDPPIFIRHWLLPNKSLLYLHEFQTYIQSLKYPYFFVGEHIYIRIEDSIHFKVLTKDIPFSTYDIYISKTNQKEHSLENYTQLIQNFDIEKMPPILVHLEYINQYKQKAYIVNDGSHRIALLAFHNKPYKQHLKQI